MMTMLELLIRLEEDVGLIDIYKDEDGQQLKLETLGEITPALDAELRRHKEELIRHLPTVKQIRPGANVVNMLVVAYV